MSMLELVPWRKHRQPMTRELTDDWLTPLHRQIDQVFTEFFGAEMPRLARARPSGRFSPDMDVSETDTRYEVTAELPGMDEKDIDVTLADGVLTVRGEKHSQTEEREDDKHHYRLERSFGAFRRSFRLPAEIDTEDVSASFEKGVLKIVVPKKAAAKTATRKIEVRRKD